VWNFLSISVKFLHQGPKSVSGAVLRIGISIELVDFSTSIDPSLFKLANALSKSTACEFAT
jgi:hypothetical protein